MNHIEKILFTLRADMARQPDDLSESELSGLLQDVTAASDANLRAAAVLFDLDLEELESWAARLEFGDGMTRVKANRTALFLTLQEMMPDISELLCKWFSRNASTIMTYAYDKGLTRDEIMTELGMYFRKRFDMTKKGEKSHGHNHDRS